MKDRKPEEMAEAPSTEASQPEEPVTISEPEPSTEQEEVNWLDEMVDACIAEMPLPDKVAGLFVITPEELTGVGTAIKAGDEGCAGDACGRRADIFFEKYPVGGSTDGNACKYGFVQ